MERRIGLVAAPRVRRGGILQARDQFDASPLFRRARDYCERHRLEWYILSASHGLIPPQQVIGDTHAVVHTMTPEERARWAEDIAARLAALQARSAQPVVFTLLASQRYVELLLRAAPALPLVTPLAGLTLAARLRWFDERLRVQPRLLGKQAPSELPEE
ncbi:MAG TPA: hypothetical protein VF808_00945 [Ktedonobacterales bacterium]